MQGSHVPPAHGMQPARSTTWWTAIWTVSWMPTWRSWPPANWKS